MRSKTVVRSKNWKHLMDPSTSKAPCNGGSEVKGKNKTNKKAKLLKKSVNAVVDNSGEEDTGADQQTDEDTLEEFCSPSPSPSPSEFMKMMMQFMKSKNKIRKRKRTKGEITEG